MARRLALRLWHDTKCAQTMHALQPGGGGGPQTLVESQAQAAHKRTRKSTRCRAAFAEVCGQGATTMKIGCYARVSTQDQQTLPLQRDAIAAYAQQRGWSIVVTMSEGGSGGRARPQRDPLMRAARRRAIDAIVVWR
ncbi:MAG: recombinase family protein [Chitinophagaceae bacterium]|nr:MAG: recombinase family protein [Chitinophagaceae bacterium]